MDRELLLEIGCEELPASWLPPLTNQIGDIVRAQLEAHRLPAETAVDVLPSVLDGTLRTLMFPKLMRWDATLDDGRGDLLFGRPIRWLLFVYGGRVVPFTIMRSAAAQTGQVQEVTTGAVTYGHRFLTTSGRAGRAIKV